MKAYEGANIRNVAVIGHGHAGKTSLVSAMLYAAGANQRQGRVDDGTSTTDYDEEEIARKMSISAGLAHVEGWMTLQHRKTERAPPRACKTLDAFGSATIP